MGNDWEASRHGNTDRGRVERRDERELYFTEPPDFYIFLRYPLLEIQQFYPQSKFSTLPILEGKGPHIWGSSVWLI
jgi:hypothetical protein